MADKTANCDLKQNYRGSSREYPKSSTDGFNPGRNINISAADLDAKNLSEGVSATKRAPQKI
jgi:hypothetical protein